MFLFIIGIALSLTACGYSNTIKDTVEGQQHSVLKGVVSDVNHTKRVITVEGETKQVSLHVTENSIMVNQLDEAIAFEDLENGLEVSVSWLINEAGEQNQVELEELEVLD